MGSNQNVNRFIYSVKLIAALFVITIHAPFQGLFGDVVQSISKFAVPFFFAASGRFLLLQRDGTMAKDTSEIRQVVLGRLKKLLKATGFVYMVYLAYSFMWNLYMGISISEWFHSKFNSFEARNFFLFNSGKFIYDPSYTFDHMWYLFALIYVYALIIIFAPVLRKWYKGLIAILLFFLYFGEALQTYYPIRPFGIGISTWYVMRNWLFVGMPFVLIGVLFADYVNDTSVKDKDYTLLAFGLIIAGIISSFIELHVFGPKDVFLGSLLIVTGLLFASQQYESFGRFLWILGKEASSNIYYYHVLVIAVMDLLIGMKVIPSVNYGLRPLIVITVCFLLFGIIPLIYRRGKINEQK